MYVVKVFVYEKIEILIERIVERREREREKVDGGMR